jgi:hypothetical protein
MKSRTVLFAVLMSAAAGAAPLLSAQDVPGSGRDAARQWSEDGLARVAVKGLDAVYARPGAAIGDYTKIRLAPIEVSFRRDWGKGSVGATRIRVHPDDAQRIREELSALVREELLAQLAQGGYPLVDQPGDDVLELDARIVNLYIQAPELARHDSGRTYAVSAGEMSLVAELRDSTSGETAMRLYDRTEARETTRVHWISGAENRSEARRAAKDWARQLLGLLDQAKAVPAQ